jgi:molybdopterin-containing oxidoreductase family iron-sulfur binding subunit
MTQTRWAMVIDLDLCNGCQACVVACQAENNVPISDETACVRGKEMNWLRVQRYWVGDKVVFVPLMCQQCETAPCEMVCPMFATAQSPTGLNEMTYNRCIGTRLCINACPYKVRVFNWREPTWPVSLREQLNSDVSVRTRGVAEKCTFCVQRIREASWQSPPAEPVPACAQTCPTRAIKFGNINDPQSEVATLAKDPRAYRLLEDFGTKPAVIYLKKIEHEPAL